MKKHIKLLSLIAAVVLCLALVGGVWASGSGIDAVWILQTAVGLREPDGRQQALWEAAAALAEPTPTRSPFIVITPQPIETTVPTVPPFVVITPQPTPDPASGSDITVTPQPTPERVSGSDAG